MMVVVVTNIPKEEKDLAMGAVGGWVAGQVMAYSSLGQHLALVMNCDKKHYAGSLPVTSENADAGAEEKTG